MATIKFRIRSKANKQVSISVYLSIAKGFMLEAKTGFTINPKDWSIKTGKPKQTDAVNKKLANHLIKLENHLTNKFNEDLGAEKVVFDNNWLCNEIENCFNRVKSNDTSLVANHYQYIIDNARTRKIKGTQKIGLSESRIKSYKNSKRILEEYQTVIKKQIHFVHIDKSFVDGFTKWLFDVKKYSISHCNKQLADIKTVALDAQRFEIQINSYVKHIDGFAENSEDRFIATLSFDELEQIRNIELKREGLINARKWMLLGCEIGQRGGDLLNITKDNIRYNGGNMYLDLVQTKTGKAVTVPIIAPHIIDIVENNMPYKVSDQKLNKHIKEVCKLANIDNLIDGKKWDAKTGRKKLGMYPKHELITNHSFRRSFATNYYKKMPTPILMGITGHSKESTFLIYINQKEDKDTNADLFRDFWEKMQDDKEPQMKVSKRVSNE